MKIVYFVKECGVDLFVDLSLSAQSVPDSPVILVRYHLGCLTNFFVRPLRHVILLVDAL